MKKLIAALVGYLAVTSVLAGGLLGGVLWLTSTNGADGATPRVAPIPPRIADSIERKKAAVPAQAPAAAPMPVKPLQEASVALRRPMAAKWSIREISPLRAKKREVRSTDWAAVRVPDDAAVPSNRVTPNERRDNFSGL